MIVLYYMNGRNYICCLALFLLIIKIIDTFDKIINRYSTNRIEVQIYIFT